jgi:hypothetical protein
MTASSLLATAQVSHSIDYSSGTGLKTVPVRLLDTPALQHLLRQLPYGVCPARAGVDDHVENRSILDSRTSAPRLSARVRRLTIACMSNFRPHAVAKKPPRCGTPVFLVYLTATGLESLHGGCA